MSRNVLIFGGAAAALAVGLGAAYLLTRDGSKVEDLPPDPVRAIPELEVVLLDKSMQSPIEGGLVTTVGGLLGGQTSATDASGVAVFTPIPRDQIALTARADGYKSFSKNITFGDKSMRVTLYLERLLSPALETHLSVECRPAMFKASTGTETLGQLRVQMVRSDGTPLAGERVDLWLDRRALGGLCFTPQACDTISTPTQPGQFTLIIGPDGTTQVIYFKQTLPDWGSYLKTLFGFFIFPVRDESLTVTVRSQRYQSVSAACQLRVRAEAL